MLGMHRGEKRLNALMFGGAPDTLQLAMVVDRETEARRARELTTPRGAALIPLGILAQTSVPTAETWSWFELATDLAVIRDCAKALEIGVSRFLDRVIQELHPPNWETFFFIRAWWEETMKSVEQEERMEELIAAQRRMAEEQRANATEGGKKKHQKQYGPAQDFVKAEWKAHGQGAYGGNKSAFARHYVRRLLNEFGCVATERTIAISWLKGL